MWWTRGGLDAKCMKTVCKFLFMHRQKPSVGFNARLSANAPKFCTMVHLNYTFNFFQFLTQKINTLYITNIIISGAGWHSLVKL